VTTSVSLHDVVRDLKDERDELRAENARLRADLAEAHRHIDEAGRVAAAEHAEAERLRGAMAASDERLRVHGERVGLHFDCDNPEHMADEILALRAALAAAPRWVSVTERLPEQGEENETFVLSPNYRKPILAWLGHRNAWQTRAAEVGSALPTSHFWEPVTHWLELPPAPGAEAAR
jgi:hypothetical protein